MNDLCSAGVHRRILSEGGVADFSDRAKLRLTGADRIRYLNGQVSSDVRKLTPDSSQYACVMTAKGKMSADIFITLGADFLRLDAAPSLRESLAARLERYIVSDDVTLSDGSTEESLLHLAGPAAEAPPPACMSDFKPVRSRRLGLPGLDWFIPAARRDSLLAALSGLHPVIAPPMAEILRIEAGIPAWGAELGEETIPVEAGLDRTAIDYAKGCYIGQEIISRLRGIGHVNRSLRGFLSLESRPLTPGARLFQPGTQDKEAGRITSAAFSFALDKFVALGYLRRGIEARELVAEAEADGGGSHPHRVAVVELPFSI